MKNSPLSVATRHTIQSERRKVITEILVQQLAVHRLDVGDETIETVARDDQRAAGGAHAPSPIRDRRAARSTWPARAGASPSGASRPTASLSSTSDTPPTSVLTPAQPAAMLSISATGVPSLREVSRNTSVAP